MVSSYNRYEKLLDAQENRYKRGAKLGAAKRAKKIKKKGTGGTSKGPTPRPRPNVEERLARKVLATHKVDRGVEKIADARPYPRVGHGVFFLIAEGEVVYAGSGLEMSSRVWECSRWIVFDEVRYYPEPRGRMKEIETAYIRVMRPKFNRRSLTEPEATNRDRVFTSRWTERKIKG